MPPRSPRVSLVCKACRKAFLVFQSQQYTAKYCSRACSAGVTRVHLLCQQCQKPFTVSPSASTSKYCSRICQGLARKESRAVSWACEVCGKTAVLPQYRAKKKRFCSHTCFSAQRKATPEKFWARVDMSGGPDACWPWQGRYAHSGHGQVTWYMQSLGAHRIAFLLTYGPTPDGLQTLHRCNNPPCCNPAHLYAGTPKDNVDDRTAEGYHKQRTPRGEQHALSKLTVEQVLEIRQCQGIETTVAVAKRYGVAPITISHVWKRNTWKHV
jgi:hypothetical protein